MYKVIFLFISYLTISVSYCVLDIVPVKKLILVGMSGVGKSTLAKQYARFYSLPHYDTDTLLTKKYPNIYGNNWEDFREKESEIFTSLLGQDYYIISTGGGIIEKDENIELFNELKKDPEVKIINVYRDVPEEIKKSRVLPNSWYILNKERFPLYKKISTAEFTNDKTPLHFISWLKQVY